MTNPTNILKSLAELAKTPQRNLGNASIANSVAAFNVAISKSYGDSSNIEVERRIDARTVGERQQSENPLDLTCTPGQIFLATNGSDDVLYLNAIRADLVPDGSGNSYTIRPQGEHNISLKGYEFVNGVDQGTTGVAPKPILLSKSYQARASSQISIGGSFNYDPQATGLGAGQTVQLTLTNSQNRGRANELLIPEDLRQAGLILGTQLKLHTGQDNPVILSYRGLTSTVAISPSTPLFGAQNASDKFSVGINEGDSLILNINGSDTQTFTFSRDADVEGNRFSSLHDLYALLAQEESLLVKDPSSINKLYIGAKDPRNSISFTGVLAEALGLADNPISLNDEKDNTVFGFNSLQGLVSAIDQAGNSMLNAYIVDDQGQIVKPEDINNSNARIIRFATTTPESILNIEIDTSNAWFSTNQAFISRQKPGIVNIVARELNNSLQVGDTIQIQGYKNSADTPSLDNERLTVLALDAQNGIISVSGGDIVEDAKFNGQNKLQAVTEAFQIRKIAAANITKNLVITEIASDNAAQSTLTITTTTPPKKGDQVYIPHLAQILQTMGVAQLQAISCDKQYEVINNAADSFTIKVNAKTTKDGDARTENIYITKANVPVLRDFSDRAEDAGLIKVYQSLAQNRYVVGDKVVFRNLKDDTVRTNTAAEGGNYIQKDEQYEIKRLGRDEFGDFFVLKVGSGGVAGDPTQPMLTYADASLGNNTYIDHISGPAAYLGINRSSVGLGSDSGFGPAYDVNGINAPNLTQASFASNPSLKAELAKRTTVVMGSIIDDLGVEHPYKISLMPINNTVQVEIALLRGVNGKYNCEGITEASDGIIATGRLSYTNTNLTSIEGSIADNIQLYWAGADGKRQSSNSLRFNFQKTQFMSTGETTIGQNIIDETGRKPVILNSSQELNVDSDGIIRIKMPNGQTTGPLYRIALYKVLNDSMLQPLANTSGYQMPKAEAGRLAPVKPGETQINTSSIYSSGIDSTQQQMELMVLANHRAAVAAAIAKKFQNEHEVLNTIKNIQ